jgi:probable F420-dependent oxidoreductase
MEFGLHIPNTGALAREADLVTIAKRAEQIGYQSVWVSDRILNPTRIKQESLDRTRSRRVDPEARIFEAIASLAVIGGATSRVVLGTRVLLPALRNPVVLAREIATIEAMVGQGRLMIGVGVGWMSEEFELAGISPDDRIAAMEESVALMREVWTGKATAFDGNFYRPAEARFLPAPSQPIKILVGGHSRDALQRAARWGDGWIMQAERPDSDLAERMKTQLLRLKRCCDDVGRDVAELTIVGSLPLESTIEAFQVMQESGVDICDLMLTSPEQLDMSRAEEIIRDIAPRVCS